jgi:hypothetical protein
MLLVNDPLAMFFPSKSGRRVLLRVDVESSVLASALTSVPEETVDRNTTTASYRLEPCETFRSALYYRIQPRL